MMHLLCFPPRHCLFVGKRLKNNGLPGGSGVSQRDPKKATLFRVCVCVRVCVFIMLRVFPGHINCRWGLHIPRQSCDSLRGFAWFLALLICFRGKGQVA